MQRPALVHFDLWDGNVFVAPTPDGWRLTGMIDGERALFGDPYAEFVSIALFRDIRQLPSVLDGYAEVTGEPVEFTEDVRIRIAMYTCYLYLIMVTEGPTRGFDPVDARSDSVDARLAVARRAVGHPLTRRHAAVRHRPLSRSRDRCVESAGDAMSLWEEFVSVQQDRAEADEEPRGTDRTRCRPATDTLAGPARHPCPPHRPTTTPPR